MIKKHIKNITFLSSINAIYRRYFSITRRKFGYIDKTAFYRQPILIKGVENVYMEEHTSILSGAVILSTNAKFVMKKKSGAAEGLTVVTGNHESPIGKWHRDIKEEEKSSETDKDVIVEEDVWIAANVTLLAGITVGRGSIIGAGSVVRNNIPPYAIVVGNPAKIIGFKFSPEEVIVHEKVLYPENKRIDIEILNKNYNKYFVNRIKEIRNYLR